MLRPLSTHEKTAEQVQEQAAGHARGACHELPFAGVSPLDGPLVGAFCAPPHALQKGDKGATCLALAVTPFSSSYRVPLSLRGHLRPQHGLAWWCARWREANGSECGE